MKNITKIAICITIVLFIIFVLRFRYRNPFGLYSDFLKIYNKNINHKIKNSSQIDANQIPKDFPTYKVIGESATKNDFLIAPHTNNYNDGRIFIMDYKGNLKRSKRLSGFAYNFKEILGEDNKIYYAYQQADKIIPRSNKALDWTHIVLMDKDFNEIDNNIKLLKNGSIPYDGYPSENHEYEILGENHYILGTAIEAEVNNIPGHEGESYFVFNNIIQEQKDGEVIWQWESINYPELYESRLDLDRNNGWETFNSKNSKINKENYAVADYAHMNSFEYTSDHKLLISFRNIGIVKVDLNTNKIIWIISNKRNDIKGLKTENISLYQHDIEILDDGSFSIFDNIGHKTNYSRLCRYKIDDEKKELISFKAYRTIRPKSLFMGSATLVDENNSIYDIAYGGDIRDIAFEEFDFKRGKQLMWMRFDEGYDLYSIERSL